MITSSHLGMSWLLWEPPQATCTFSMYLCNLFIVSFIAACIPCGTLQCVMVLLALFHVTPPPPHATPPPPHPISFHNKIVDFLFTVRSMFVHSTVLFKQPLSSNARTLQAAIVSPSSIAYLCTPYSTEERSWPSTSGSGLW